MTLFSVLTRLIGFLFKIYLSRIISTETLGLYSIVLSIYMVFITLVGAGMPTTISKATASNKVSNNYQNTHSMVSSGIILELLFSIILIAIILIFKNVFVLFLGSNSSYYTLLTLIPAIICTGIYSPLRGYLWGEEQYFKVSIVEFIEQIFKIATLFILVKINVDLNNLLPIGFAISISAILSTIVGFIFYFVLGGRLIKKDISFKPIISSALPLTTTRFFGSLMQPLISIILPFRLIAIGYTKSQSLSMLGIAMGMTFPILTIPSTLIGSLAMVLIPEIATTLKSGNNSNLKKQINSSILFTMCCSFICMPILYSLSDPICTLLFNNYEAGLYLKFATWTILPSGLSAITTSILNSLNKEKLTFRYFIISAIVTILTIVIAPKFMGINSLFLALGLGTTITFILNIHSINKITSNNHKTYKELFLLTLITIPCTLLTKYLYNIFLIMYGNIFAIIFSTIITCMCFVLLLVSFNLLNISLIIKTFSKKKSKKLAK